MKITKTRLKQIIKEELEKVLQDSARANLFSEGQGATGRRRIDHKKEVAKKQKILKALAQSQAEMKKQGLDDLFDPDLQGEFGPALLHAQGTYFELINDIYNSYGISVFDHDYDKDLVYILTNDNEELVYSGLKHFKNDPMVRKLDIHMFGTTDPNPRDHHNILKQMRKQPVPDYLK